MLQQIAWLFVLSLPVASITWTVTHEEIFRELRDDCATRSRTCRRLVQRKFFYVFTCEYCFSHYVALAFVVLTGYRLLVDDWRGLLIAWLSVVGLANVYMSLFGRLRVDIKAERLDIASKEQDLDADPAGINAGRPSLLISERLDGVVWLTCPKRIRTSPRSAPPRTETPTLSRRWSGGTSTDRRPRGTIVGPKTPRT